MKNEIVELEIKISELQTEQDSIPYEELKAISDLNESLRSRGITEAGNQPRINAVHREFERKKALAAKNLGEAKHQLVILKASLQSKKTLKSMHLITQSIGLLNPIFLVLDERYELPIRFDGKDEKGMNTMIAVLHNIAYIVNAPGKREPYNKKIADNINNGIFRRQNIADYMKSNGLEKPTLVKKARSNNYMVLANDVPVKTKLVQEVPTQFRSLYIDKTK